MKAWDVEGTSGTAMAEAKGIAASCVQVGAAGASVMNRLPERLVRRVQGQLTEPEGKERGRVAPDVVEQLQARLGKLHRLGAEFAPIRLSSYVAG